MKKSEIKEMTNFKLLEAFQDSLMNISGAKPTKKAYRELTWIITELGQRLDLTQAEIEKLINS